MSSLAHGTPEQSLPAEGVSGGHRGLPATHLFQFCILWMLLAAVAAAFFFQVPQSIWHNELLPTGGRLASLVVELLSLTAFTFVVSLPMALVTVWLRAPAAATPEDTGGVREVRTPGRTQLTLPGRILAAGLLFGMFFLYCASWGVFHSTGQFLGRTGVRLWLVNPVQLLQHAAHMEPLSLLLYPIGAAGLAVLAGLVLSTASARLGERGRRRLVRGTLSLVVLMLLASSTAFLQRWRFVILSLDRAGPVTSALLEVERALTTQDDPMHHAPNPALEHRPLLSIDDYLATADTSAVRRHHVIVIIVESLRPDQLEAYGSERSVMPTVDALAREGRAFLDHYSQASHSDYADPAPLSSQYPLRSQRYSVYPEEINYPRVLLYDILDPLGYRTAVISSQNENWNGMIHYLRTDGLDYVLHSDNYEGPTYVPRVDPHFYDFIKGTRRAGKIDDRYTVREAIRWIEAGDGAPFFLYMNLQNSHLPYELPADFPPRFGTGEVGFALRFGYFPPDSVDAVKDLYANSLAYVDAQIGKLVSYLEERDLLERTILIVTGDTGQAFYEHGFTSHGGALYDEVVRVPLLIRGPGVQPGRDTVPAQHIDVPPSVLDIMGLPPHPGFQGVSLFSGEIPPNRPRFIVGHARADQYAVVASGYKLIYDADAGQHLLYDLRSDPAELEDIAGAHPELVRHLAGLLHGWRKAQISYYEDWTAQRRWYPPVLSSARTLTSSSSITATSAR